MRDWTRGSSALALTVVLGGAIWAESPAVRPEAVGVSSERLRRLGAVLRRRSGKVAWPEPCPSSCGRAGSSIRRRSSWPSS